ncbi:hypothetical protein ONA91_20785 [Micromonospora sp. DR5-3]|uniref:hypothetical protein n=1 Tax=unclassified Micromonospora TaxID=2617518 RepID=UPI0011D69530|nr:MULTISPECIES: hypothetical protein [unclassified Micromonospora]MCW3816886.1 hypothetical protein [Micromonospora sp. DR5-3]TYC23392.1 hypothetical protein FXF52_15440 [Micromonospora sp. MP36]
MITGLLTFARLVQNMVENSLDLKRIQRASAPTTTASSPASTTSSPTGRLRRATRVHQAGLDLAARLMIARTPAYHCLAAHAGWMSSTR